MTRFSQISSLAWLAVYSLWPSSALAQDAADPSAATPPAKADPLLMAVGDGSLKFSIEAGLQYVVERNAYWNFSDALAPEANFDADPAWGEGYVHAGATLVQPVGKATVTAGVSAIAARTFGRDIFDQRNRGRLVSENAYASIQFDLGAKDRSLTLSGGAQPFKLGNGMLIGDGGVDGFERGAVIFGPRRAWANTVIARLALGKWTIEGFHLNAHELKSSDTRTLINGGRVEYSFSPGRSAGLAYAHVPRSEAPYAQAPLGGVGIPSIIENGRDGLSFVQAWFNIAPIRTAPTFYIAGDYARQRNSRINMKAWGGRFEVGNTFIKAPWTPTLSYSFQTFSGDDPDTRKLERFDPIFYDGGQSAWATGTNGSFIYINTNVRAHRFFVTALPTPKDIVTLRYVSINANKLRSPIQFGQATRPDLGVGAPGLVSGVTKRHLSDDLLLEYTHILTDNIFLSFSVGHSWPAKGLKTITPTLDQWTGGLVNVLVRY